MKNVILAFSAMFAMATASFAQNAAPAPAQAPVKEMKGHGKKMKDAAEKGKGQVNNALGLSAEQETSFKALNRAHQAAVAAVDKDKALAKDAKSAKIAELKAKYEADVKGVMNDEQYGKWLALRAKRDEKQGDKKEDKKEERNEKKGGKHGKAKGDKSPQPEAK
jgi:hypothetical protein